MSNRITCKHLESFTVVFPPEAYVCEECVKTGSRWVHLRRCQTCGATLCCDSSPNKHASKHARESTHPVAITAEPGEKWACCYEDSTFIEL